MIEDLLPVGISRPGFYANGTIYQSKGRWHEGNLVRFSEGTVQAIGGWIRRGVSGAAILGTPIAAICWQLADGTPFLAIGTTSNLYVMDDNNVVYDITPTSGTLHAPPFDWDLKTFGAYLIAVNSLNGDDDISLVNTYVWTGNTATPAATAWTSAIGPIGAYSAFVTPERFLVVLRGQDPSGAPARSGVDTPYSERRVYWASQEELSEFISTDINTGGNFDLTTDGRLVVGTPARGQSLIWSDTDLWAMNFIGGELIYSFQNVGTQCGIVGKNAFVKLDKGTFWMGRGKFFVYDGFVRAIPCEVTDHVFGDFNDQRAHTVWALPNSKFNEVTWFYPSLGEQYPDRYVTYNYVEDHWVFGELDRSIGVPQRFRQDVIDETKPYLFAANAFVYEHESGNERNAQAWLASGPVELAGGDRLMRIQGVMPDDLRVGDMNLRLYTTMAPDALETLNGPYALSPITSIRLTARQVRIRLEEAGSGADWRVGYVRLGVRAAERRGSGPGPIDTTPVSLEIIPPAVTLLEAQHYTFQAIIRNAAGEVLDLQPDVWISSDSTDITVNDSGTVTINTAPATSDITATYTPASLVSNIAVVTVLPHIPASISIESTVNVEQGLTTQLHATVFDINGFPLSGVPLTWTTSDGTKVLVDSTGLLTGVDVPVHSANIQAHYTHGLITGDVDINSNVCVASCVKHWAVHVFTGDGALVVTTGGSNADLLMLGGGGSGGSVDGTGVGAGGGGAGGAIHESGIFSLTAGSHAITMGGGGIAPIADHTIGGGVFGVLPGNNGTATSAFSRVAGFGGGGGGSDATLLRKGRAGGVEGGSGGGGASAGDVSPPAGAYFGGAAGLPDSITSFGNAGGNGDNVSTEVGAGGGGALTVGGGGGLGTGGLGLTLDIEDKPGGATKTYAIGGRTRNGVGGSPVAANMGHGGEGGGLALNCQGSNGSGGRVVVRYALGTGIVATGGVKTIISM